MTTVFLPENPTTGQQYAATNGATYTWLGNRWSSTYAIALGTATPYYEGGNSLTESTNILDGGTSQ